MNVEQQKATLTHLYQQSRQIGGGATMHEIFQALFILANTSLLELEKIPTEQSLYQDEAEALPVNGYPT